MMDGYDLDFGKDGLDMINPLVDWRNNTVLIRYGHQLYTMSSNTIVQVKPCGIKGRGLNGLQDTFIQLREEEQTSF